jgi:hypothetical protein
LLHVDLYAITAAAVEGVVVVIESVKVTGRSPQPFWKKLNPLWWFLNDGEQTVDGAPWYKPDYPWLIRYLFWNFLRNPMMNFRNYVIGVGDRNYEVIGKAPAMTIQRDDLAPPELGWQWSMIRLRCGFFLPFSSYCGERLVVQLCRDQDQLAQGTVCAGKRAILLLTRFPPHARR